MTVPRNFRYRAFLSYSHRDMAAGEALHKAIESYRVPRELAGQPGAFGLIPKGNVRPIFRDRYELSAGPSLNSQVLKALEQSEALIVLCSPAAAQSHYVQEEIRQFKMLGRGHRIYPVIASGEPGDPQRECFPASLRMEYGPDGVATGATSEPIAADLRDSGEGADLAKLKLVAGLVGANLSELTQRELVEQRRRQRRMMALAATMSVLAVAAVGFGLRTQALSKEVFQSNEKLSASLVAETAAKTEAQERYLQSLKSTLRLVVLSATFRSLTKGTDYRMARMEGKANNSEFSAYLTGDPHTVWFLMAETLLNFQAALPHELSGFEEEIKQREFPRQWAEHAAGIMTTLMREPRPGYQEQLDRANQQLARLGGPRKQCNPDKEDAARQAEEFRQVLLNQPQAQMGAPLPACEQ